MCRFGWSRQAVAFGATSLLIIASCGPLQVPMGRQLDQNQQAAVDAGWQRALEFDDELGRQGWLDMMVGTLAFEHGVDRFHFKSEKEVGARLVVMEVWFDRSKPDDDAFEITVFDDERKIVRKERYTRSDVEESIAVMYQQPETVTPPVGVGQDEWRRLREKQEERRARIKLLFPDANDDARPADAAAPSNMD